MVLGKEYSGDLGTSLFLSLHSPSSINLTWWLIPHGYKIAFSSSWGIFLHIQQKQEGLCFSISGQKFDLTLISPALRAGSPPSQPLYPRGWSALIGQARSCVQHLKLGGRIYFLGTTCLPREQKECWETIKCSLHSLPLPCAKYSCQQFC